MHTHTRTQVRARVHSNGEGFSYTHARSVFICMTPGDAARLLDPHGSHTPNPAAEHIYLAHLQLLPHCVPA
jgi:hypothetical protein